MRRTLTALALVALALAPPLAAQTPVPDSGAAPGFPMPPAFTPLKAPSNPALRPGGRYGPATTPDAVAARWAAQVDTALANPEALHPGEWTLQAPTAENVLGPRTYAAAGQGIGAYANIGLQLNVRFEAKADQLRNLACTPYDRQNPLSGCTARFPTISPNPQYSILSSGLIGQRLHVNVDFDSQREFDANNTVQVWYEGLPDEVLRRVEAGNVSFSVPASRFISAAVPANNFGFQAIAQVGDLQLRGIYAQQKGTVAKDRIYTVGQVTNQSVARDGRDLDFETGRFFFAVDPAKIPGYPAVDILNLPSTLQVQTLVVYRMHAVAPGNPSNENIGGIKAVACGAGATQAVQCSGAGVERAGPFQWQILVQGRDYYVDPSQTWFALASALDQNDYLAVSYVPVGSTDTVGTLPLTASTDTTKIDTLRLVYDPTPSVTARSPAFRFEIRSVYRFGSSDLTRETAQLSITVNQRERPALSGQTYLQLLGLSLATNPTQFDQYNRLFPRTRDPQGGLPLRDLYVVFPSLIPFADTAKLQASERNDSLYRTPRGLLSTQGPPSLFALHYQATAVASADRSTLSLNSFQIREGSEKIFVAGNQLTRGTDYTIDYATGTVQFLHPDSLFVNGTSQVRAQFEERTGFAVAPTSIYGLAGEYSLGATGRVDVTGLFQQQTSPFTRPPLGSEPSSSFIGGISTDLHFQPGWLTDAVGKIPGVRADAPSYVNLTGELAFSRPSPNSTGQAYLEEFESEASRFISLADADWHWGSIPTTTRGAEPYGFTGTFDPTTFSGGFDPRNAAFMTWQSLPANPDGSLVQFLPQQIDPQIVLAGATQIPEPVLWLTLKPDTVLGLAHNGPTDSLIGTPNWVRPPVAGPRWRSITQTLSATGIDLTRTEYLEFWVWEDNKRTAAQHHTAVLFDFGSVFEDALAFVPDSFYVNPATGDTTYYGQDTTGIGRLDTERDPRTHSWNADLNDEGILSDRVTHGIFDMNKRQMIDTLPLCSAAVNGVVAQFAFGDPRSRCGRHNGVVDTEDQDGDFQLDSVVGVKTQENFVRFVFPIGSDKYYVRDGGMVPVSAAQGGGAAGWRLYRIPFRTDTIMQGAPNLRQVQALRVTIVAPEEGPAGTPQPQVFFALSRLQLVGASWLKRADTPIRGIGGQTGALGGQVVASFVSTQDRDLGYTPPPGVTNQAANQGANLSLSSTQINEQSLRILASGLQKGEHAEAYDRFTTEGDKNLLRYREVRVWARGRGPGWDDGDLEFYLKLGKDENNFYMYHTPVRTSSWEPEVVAEFQPWLILRTAIEARWLRGDPPQIYPGCPDTSIVPFDSSYVMCDGPYMVHIHDPATAPPNLAAVEELAAGILRVADKTYVDQAELWVDDIRVSNVRQDVGMAAAMDMSVTASNLADVTLDVTQKDANFQQLGSDPTYSTDVGTNLSGTFHLERLVPQRWGLVIPLAVAYTSTSSAPYYVDGTDILADQLQGLRTPVSTGRTLSLGIRRVKRAAGFLGRYLLDPVAVNVNVVNGDSRTSLSSASGTTFSYTLAYAVVPGALRVPFVPKFIAGLVHHLPGFLRRAPLLKDVDHAEMRLNPSQIAFTSVYAGAQSSQLNFPVAVREPSDATIRPSAYYTRTWRNSGNVQLAPFSNLSLGIGETSVRDLRDYGDSTSVGRLLGLERRSLLGQDIGIETQRAITGNLSFTPNFGLAVRPRFVFTGQYNLSRDPNAPTPVLTADSAFRLPLSYAAAQRLDAGALVDLGRLGAGLFGDSSLTTRVLRHLTSVNVSYTRSRQSSFAQVPDPPSTGYQLGLASLGGFRTQDSVLATSALENTATSASATADLILGLRLSTSYQSTRGVTWVLQGATQVPQVVTALDWPSGTVAWSLTPPRTGLGVGRLLSGITAQLTVRRHETSTRQTVSGGLQSVVSLTQATERSLAPSVTLSWFHGILTSADYTSDVTETAQSGSLFRTRNTASNAYVAFAFKPPEKLVHLPTPIRANARYTLTSTVTCIEAAGVSQCVPYVDTRQRQTQFSMDTDFPPTFSAGLQVGYILNEQKQLNQKTGDLTITAYVSFSTSVGQFR